MIFFDFYMNFLFKLTRKKSLKIPKKYVKNLKKCLEFVLNYFRFFLIFSRFFLIFLDFTLNFHSNDMQISRPSDWDDLKINFHLNSRLYSTVQWPKWLPIPSVWLTHTAGDVTHTRTHLQLWRAHNEPPPRRRRRIFPFKQLKDEV